MAGVRVALLLGLLGIPALSLAAGLSPDAQALHVLDRLGYGPRPGDLQRVEAMGIDRYIDQQLAADQPEPIALTLKYAVGRAVVR